MATFSAFITNSYLTTFVLLLALTTMSLVCGIKLPLFHKNHPSVRHLLAPSLLEEPYKANLTFEAEYIVHFSVGTPPFKTFAVFDTASPVLWLQSSTCEHCMPQNGGNQVDLGQSLSLEHVRYNSEDCRSWMQVTNTFSGFTLDGVENCYYHIAYPDGTNSTGYVATDLITFEDGLSTGEEMNVRLMMGVGLLNYGSTDNPAPPGIFGMSPEAWYQVNTKFQITKFSFCMPTDQSDAGYVSFGNASYFVGPSIQYNDGDQQEYSLNLTGISFNADPVVPRDHGRDSWDGFRMIIDTGSPVSRIHPDIFDALQNELELLLGDYIYMNDRYSMCWVDVDIDVIGKLSITLYFGIVEFNLYESHIWSVKRGIKNNKVVQVHCFNVIRMDTSGHSILGTMQSTDKNIAINWLSREIAIEDSICL